MTPHIHCVIVSYNRQPLTQQTLESWLATVEISHSVCIVDNHSEPETIEWLQTLEIPVRYLDKNYYPGFAANRGFEMAPPETTMLQRSDNDTKYLPGWDRDLAGMFESDRRLGQIGVWAEGDQHWISMPRWPVGGNSIIRREIWDEGLRYTEIPWPELEIIEEHQLTLDVWKRKYKRAFAPNPGIEYLWMDDPKYYRQSYADRGLDY